jgi:Ger(x)C family germination protein
MMKHLKHCLLLVMVFFLVLPVGGCMDAMDINKKYIVTTLAIDKVGDEFWFYAEVANVQSSGSNGSGGGPAPLGSKFFYVKGSGKNFEEARLDVDRQLDLPIYISGVRTLLLTERFADEDDDLVQYLYRVRADEAYRKKVLTVTTRDNLDEMFSALNKKNFSVGYSIENTVTSLEQQGEAFSRTTSRLLENISSRYCGVLIPCIGIKNEDTILSGYSVVNGAKVTGYIPMEDCIGLIILKSDNARTFFDVPYQDKIYTVKTTLESKAITPYYQNGEISYLFKLHFKATVEYGDSRTPYNLNTDALKKMENTLRQIILDKMITTLDQARNMYKTDYLQMDDAFRMKYPAVFDQLDWQPAFLNAKAYWDVKADLSVSPSLNYETNPAR